MSRTLGRLAAGAALVYALLCGFYYLAQDAMIFPGARVIPVRANVPSVPIELTSAGANLRGHLINPTVTGAAIFYFGGNAEPVTAYAERFARLPARSYLIDYRGYGASDGFPSQSALVEDAVRTVSGFTNTEDRVLMIGRSLGTGVAALAAAQLDTRVRGMVLISPFCSFGNVVALHAPPFLPARLLLAHPFDVESIAATLPQRLTILIGAADTLIPPAESRCLATVIGPSAETIEIPAAGHNDILASDIVWQAIDRSLGSVTTSAGGELPRPALP